VARRNWTDLDRFGNPHAPNLPYARGEILRSTEDDFRKLQRARWHPKAWIACRGICAIPDTIFGSHNGRKIPHPRIYRTLAELAKVQYPFDP